ncbi:MAG: spermidine/putrescine ABC transporter substrate-binding protein [Actinomycetia bacterium]|nr:spermidine/putrescine ABC transporter substrate-binding protein [Actinomycetes bacterium]
MRSSRRDFLARSAQLGVALGAGVPLLQSCADNGKKSVNNKTIADGLEPEKGPLRIVNYDSYVNPDVLADFEAKYGVKTELTTIFSDTEVVTKIASGAIKVDVQHSMANTSIGNMIAGGLLQPLNKSYIPNFANVISNFNDPFYDPGAKYSVPYTFFGTGIGYRTDRIDPADVEAQGWDTIWNATDFAGEVSVLDDEREALVMAMMRRGLFDVNTVDPEVINQALADITELIDLVSVKVNIEAYKDIPEGTTSIAQTWSADLIASAAGYLPEGVSNDVLGFWHPPAGEYVVTNDSMGVLADAEHPVLAHLYLNYLLDNDVSEKNFTWVGYLPALSKLDADYLINAGYVPEHLRNCVPTQEEIDNGLVFKQLDVDGEALYEEAWSKFNAGG